MQKDQTGSHSVYTTFEEHEIMFHVSTMLPYSKEDRQQVSVRQQIDVMAGWLLVIQYIRIGLLAQCLSDESLG